MSETNHYNHQSMGRKVWRHFASHKLGLVALGIVVLFCIAGIYAPFLASSNPLVVRFDGQWYFPLFRYLFYAGFYTKLIDIFFNLLIFTLPLGIVLGIILRNKPYVAKIAIAGVLIAQFALFAYFCLRTPKDPASDPILNRERQEALVKLRKNGQRPDWDFDLRYMNSYAKLNLVLENKILRDQNQRLQKYEKLYGDPLPTLWQMEQTHNQKLIDSKKALISAYEQGKGSEASYKEAQAALRYIYDKQRWLDENEKKITFMVMPLLRTFHWEQDAGGDQKLNQILPWWDVTRINRKDLVSALIFGIRISLVVGILSVGLALMIGIPIGAYAGYYGGKIDIVVSRLLEIWEAMADFFYVVVVCGHHAK